MNLWFRHVDHATVIAPLDRNTTPSEIDSAYDLKELELIEVPQIYFTDTYSILKSIFFLPYIIKNITTHMRSSTHIHLRCPGNMGLLGCVIQMFFPNTKKTAKYAGNWDWNSKQPKSYRLQQIILRNTFLTRNMQALVYGDWPDKTSNIRPFFTASYNKSEDIPFYKPDINECVNLIFLGTLSSNKRPILALQVLQELLEKGFRANLVYCGDGKDKARLHSYADEHQLQSHVKFLGNVDMNCVKQQLQRAHFLIFGSRSEGWPKAVAEAMWWGCIPITTGVSCVPQILGFGDRGIICEPFPSDMVRNILALLENPNNRLSISNGGKQWARHYTFEKFELEIKKLL